MLVNTPILRVNIQKGLEKYCPSRAGLRRVVALVVEARVMAEMALSPHKCAAPTAQHDTGRWQCGHPHQPHHTLNIF